uniref:Transposase n=2 Tax=Bursaphelenchus xylophilus TaxID=6326 RepID=A0A1I7SN20_BURXY
MYRKWTQQGVSSVIAALANNKLKKHRARVRDAFGKCTKEAKNINMQAICVQRLENGDFAPIIVLGK